MKNDKIKVCFVIYKLNIGGAAKAALHILNNLNKDKFDIHLILFDGPEKHQNYLAAHINTHVLNINCKGKHNRPKFSHLFKLNNTIRKIKPNILYCIGRYNNLLGILSKKLFLNKLQVIIREDSDIIEHLAHDKYKSLKLIIFRLLYPQADRVLVPAVGLRRLLNDYIYVQHEKIYVLPNPIDTTTISALSTQNPQRKSLNPLKKKQIISIGGLIPIKDYPTALEAIKKTTKYIGKFIILGYGHLEKQLKLQTQKLDLTNIVEFAEFTPNPYRELHQADIFLCTSINEGFGMNIIEAMACGTPVISTNCPHGPKNIIRDEYDGLLVPIKNPEKTARAIERLCNDSSLCEKLIKNGYKTAAKYSIENTVQQYEEFMKDILNNE